MNNLVKKVFKEMYYLPKCNKGCKSPCVRCIGIFQCAIKHKRKPNKECGAFWDKDKPIVITMEK